MGRRVNEDATNTVVSLLQKDTPIVEIGKVTNVSKTTIYRMRLNLELFGNPYTPQTVIRGRPKLLTVAQEDALIEWIKSQPTTPHLDEMASWLDQQFGTKASLATVYRTLERAGFSKKDAVKRKRRTAADRERSSPRRVATSSTASKRGAARSPARSPARPQARSPAQPPALPTPVGPVCMVPVPIVPVPMTLVPMVLLPMSYVPMAPAPPGDTGNAQFYMQGLLHNLADRAQRDAH